MSEWTIMPLGVVDLRQVSAHWGHAALPLGVALLSGGVVMLLLGIVAGIRFYRNRNQHAMPRWTFLRIARWLGLGATDVYLLWRIARRASLPTPLTLLMSAKTLHHHARRFAAGSPRWRRQWVTARVWHIRRRLSHKDPQGVSHTALL